MIIRKCDLCEKEIKEESVDIKVGFLSTAELCKSCSSPVLIFLKENKLMEEEKS